MNIYFRNLLILILIGTVNFFVYVFLSGRSMLFLGRSPTANKPINNLPLDSSLKNLYINDLGRQGLKTKKQEGRKPTNESVIATVGGVISNKTSSSEIKHPPPIEEVQNISKVVVNVTTAAKQQVAVLQSGPSSMKGLLNLYSRDDSSHINPHRYKLILDEPHTCFDSSGAPKDVFLLVLIATIHKNFEQRRAIRETWGSVKEVGSKKVVTMFLLAFNEDARLQRQVEEECSEHHDLLQEDFADSYKNLTLKTIMGMKWATSHCPHASFVMKTDDDMYVNYANLVTLLQSSRTPSKNFAAGYLINGGPIRDPRNKWYMPKDLYPESRYPPFLSGTGYVMSADVCGKVYEKSLDEKYLHLEDVFVAVCLKAVKVIPVKNRDFNNWRIAYSYCRYRKLITSHMVPPSEMHRIWKDQARRRPC